MRDDVKALKLFLEIPPPRPRKRLKAISLFSGAGIGDYGYYLAGFDFVVQVELDGKRAQVGQSNFPSSTWIVGDIRERYENVVETYARRSSAPLDLLIATPPCQGMSSSNPGRGKRGSSLERRYEEKNKLALWAAFVARRLKPRVIVMENVPAFLSAKVHYQGKFERVVDHLGDLLGEDYDFFEAVINVANYGIPQARRRAILVALRKDLAQVEALKREGRMLLPSPTHSEAGEEGAYPWITIREWFEFMNYEPLDSRERELAAGSHPLHKVPDYTRNPDRYLQIRQIPPYSGKSAYENSTCLSCGFENVPLGLATCPACGDILRNRPYVVEEGVPRLIKGFHSSYRRIAPNKPAPTITTNSSHVGSDFKIHPWEHRVLSVLEVADLQTVPRYFNWHPALRRRQVYLIRQVVGEAFPTYFAYLHGKIIYKILRGKYTTTTMARALSESAGAEGASGGDNANLACVSC